MLGNRREQPERCRPVRALCRMAIRIARIARELRQAGAVRGYKSGAAKYAKEFLTWRGISYAYCYHHHPKDQAQASDD